MSIRKKFIVYIILSYLVTSGIIIFFLYFSQYSLIINNSIFNIETYINQVIKNIKNNNSLKNSAEIQIIQFKKYLLFRQFYF